MSIFDRLKKEEKDPKAQAAPAAREETLRDFHPYDTGLDKAVWELRREYEGRTPERKSCTRNQFLALLAGVPALRKTPGITYRVCSIEDDGEIGDGGGIYLS